MTINSTEYHRRELEMERQKAEFYEMKAEEAKNSQ